MSIKSFLILSFKLCLDFPSNLFPKCFPTKNSLYISPLPKLANTLPTSFFLIWSPQYFARSTSDGAPFSEISCSPLSPHPSYTEMFNSARFIEHPQLSFLPQCEGPSFTPYKTTGKIIILYILIFVFWKPTQRLNIPSRMVAGSPSSSVPSSFLRVVPKYLNLATFSKGCTF